MSGIAGTMDEAYKRFKKPLIPFNAVTTSNGNAGGTTLISTALANKGTGNDFFNGFRIVLTSGMYAGWMADIVDYVAATGSFTVNPALGTAIVAGTRFGLIAKWSLYNWLLTGFDSSGISADANGAIMEMIKHLIAGIAILQANTRATIAFPSEVEIPESGTTTYRMFLFLYDTEGEMEAPDSIPRIVITDSAGNVQVAETDMTYFGSVGVYYYDVAIANTETPESWIARLKVIEGGDTRWYGVSFDLVHDTVGLRNDTTTDTVHGKLGTDTEMGDKSFFDFIISGYTGAADPVAVGALVERLQLLQLSLINANTMFESTAATVNTVTCASLVDRADLYEGMMIVPLTGNQAGQGRYISDYDDTGILTVVPDWSTDPDVGGAFKFVIMPTPMKFAYEAGKGLSAIYDLVNGIPVLTRVYNDYNILVLTVEETIFEYDDAAYVWHPHWLVFHLDELAAAEQLEVKIYEKDNDTDDAWHLMMHLDYLGVQAVPVKFVELPPVDLAFKVTVEQTGGVLRDVLFKLYRES